ncbi:MAG: hypothetical protein AAGE52_37170 [Myxococcota bacterium]
MTSTHRERLLMLVPLLENAPFDVDDLQEQLLNVHILPDSDAAEVVRQTLNELDRVRIQLCLVDLNGLDEEERYAHRYALDWLESAREHLLPHGLN